MEATTSISEMLKFAFGCKVFCSDGEAGTLTHVILDPSSRRLAAIGVKKGFLFGKTLYVPFEGIRSASGERVDLKLSSEEFAQASTNEPTGVVMDSGSIVQNEGTSERGSLSLLAVEPDSGEVNYIVARGIRQGQSLMIRKEYIKQLENKHIATAVPESVFKALPRYRPDSELQKEVEQILFDLTPLHVDFKGMDVRVLDGVLYLDGNISSSLRGDIVRDQALGVEGLLEIKNRLVADDELASDLAAALAHDPRTADLPIGVYPRLGVVRLSGAVRNERQKNTAEVIARSFSGVRDVVNDLSVDPKTSALHVLTASVGSDGTEIVPGKYIRHTK